MRGFILLALVAVTSVYGRPEPPSGYSYSRPQQLGNGHSDVSQSFGGNGNGHASTQPFGNGGGAFLSQGTSGAGQGFGNGQGFGSGQSFGGPGQTIVQKHIYVHVPPPDDEQEIRQQQQIAQTPRKHYKIIFIKAPSAPSITQQAIAAQAQSQEKTLIYVLVKKPEEISFDAPAAQPALAPTKPEVYFIKYKTQKEAGAPLFGGAASGGSGFGPSSGGQSFGGSGNGGSSFGPSSGGQSFGGSGNGGSSFGPSTGGQSFGGSDAPSFGGAGGSAGYVAPNPQTAYGPPHK